MFPTVPDIVKRRLLFDSRKKEETKERYNILNF